MGYKVPHLGFMALIFEDKAMVYPSCLSDIPYTTALSSTLTTVGTLQLIQSSDLGACIREPGIEQGAKRSMDTCPEAFWPNVLITFSPP